MKQHGFTLLELIMVVAVAGILLVVGVPSLQSLMSNSRMSAEVNNLVVLLNYARSEAIKRGTTVSVVPQSINGTRWQYPVSVMVNGEALRVVPGNNNITVRVPARQSVEYRGNGYRPFNDTLPIHINICDARGVESSRLITISALGRPQTTNRALSCE